MSAAEVRRVALVPDTAQYVGPSIARILGGRGHDLVVANPEDGLVDDLQAAGASVEVVEGRVDLTDRTAVDDLVARTLDRFGRLDAAVCFTGRVVTGRFVGSTQDDLDAAVRGCLLEPFNFLQAVLPPMVEQREGQVVVFTSAAGSRPTPGAPLYSAARAGANMLVRNAADEVARFGVQVNAFGTNFIDFPEFLRASGATDPDVRAQFEKVVPMHRLGTVEECGALAAGFLDGTSRFATGQIVNLAGGWA